MDIKSYIFNQRGQWKADASVKIEGTDQVLKISTSKNSRKQLVTTASVVRLERGFEVFVLYEDFYRTLFVSEPKVVNQKRVEEQQRQALDEIDIILGNVKEFYAAKEVAA